MQNCANWWSVQKCAQKAGSNVLQYKARMTKVGSAKIVNFITIGAGGLMLGRGYISHYSEYALSSTLSIYITLIAIVLREYNAAFLCHCWFFIYSIMGQLICRYDLFWQEVRVESLILRWPFRPLGLFFTNKILVVHL